MGLPEAITATVGAAGGRVALAPLSPLQPADHRQGTGRGAGPPSTAGSLRHHHLVFILSAVPSHLGTPLFPFVAAIQSVLLDFYCVKYT